MCRDRLELENRIREGVRAAVKLGVRKQPDAQVKRKPKSE
jgi:hypothetical protein